MLHNYNQRRDQRPNDYWQPIELQERNMFIPLAEIAPTPWESFKDRLIEACSCCAGKRNRLE